MSKLVKDENGIERVEVDTIETTAEELVEEKEEKATFIGWCKDHPIKAILLGVATGGIAVAGAVAIGAAIMNKKSSDEEITDEEYEEEDPDENEVEDKTNE